MPIDISTVLIHVDIHITIHIDIHINSRGLGGAAFICQQRCRCSHICWLHLYSDHYLCRLIRIIDTHMDIHVTIDIHVDIHVTFHITLHITFPVDLYHDSY